MGNGTLTTRANNTTILEAWYDDFRLAISGSIYPRATDSTPTDLGASIGSSSVSWKKLHVASGEFGLGAIKMHHSYNGLCTVSHGWMLMDGRLINEENYDAEYGAGSWDELIISSPIEDKYLPVMTSMYLVGAASIAQNGLSAITSVGNAGHLGLKHQHKWYDDNSTNAFGWQFPDFSAQLNTSGAGSASKTGGHATIGPGNGAGVDDRLPDSWTEQYSIDIKPSSIEVQFYMRIID